MTDIRPQVPEIKYSPTKYRAFFNLVRSEWAERPCQLIVRPEDNSLTVRGRYGIEEDNRLRELIQQFESMWADAPQVTISHTPMSHKRRIRQQHYRQ